jgi:phenylpropionate dioxygenase-like ring-hydroxylating dioxygenase large terminal subunit
MYMNFWYPMSTSEELSDKPLRVRCMGLDFVVFRGEDGKANCLSNTCTHRGGSLAGGKTKGNRVECPYHGWQFDGAGTCHRIPSLGPNAKIPTRARVDAYPVEERWGLIFAFLGDLPEAARPPLLEISECGREGWRQTMQQFELRANYQRSVENGLDPAHNEFVHDTHGFQGENEAYQVNDMRIEERDEWGRGFWHTFNSPKLPDGEMRKLRDYEGELEAGTGHHGPNQLWTYIHVTPENWFHQYAYERPIDDETVHIYLVTMRNCALDPAQDDLIMERNAYVADQDVAIIEFLHPVVTPSTNTKELMTPSDKVILMYRDKLKDWDGRGWRIDFEALQREGKNVAYAIPGPTRREHKGWVLDAVPLIPGESERDGLQVAG